MGVMDILPSLPTLGAFTLASFVLAITPGPDMTLFLGRTLAQGRGAGLMVLAGTCLGCVVHTVAAVTGVSAVLAASPAAFGVLKIVGALYLAWLAFQAVRGGSTFRLEAAGAPMSMRRAFLTGLGVNILNPKVLLFFMTFLPQFVTADDPAAAGKMLFLGLYFVVFSAPLLVAMILAAERLSATLQRNPRIARGLDWLFATVFAAFAIRILTARAD